MIPEPPYKVLLADDDAVDRKAIRRSLAKSDFPCRVTEVEDAESLRQYLKETSPDLILLDYKLGAENGVDLLREINGPPTILVTGAGDESLVVKAMRNGAYDYVVKDSGKEYLALLASVMRSVMHVRTIELEKDKLIHDLRRALLEIGTLRGLLPICCSCKRVREDNGFWEEVDTYIAQHTEAVLSHGYCPDCEKKAMEELDDADTPT